MCARACALFTLDINLKVSMHSMIKPELFVFLVICLLSFGFKEYFSFFCCSDVCCIPSASLHLLQTLPT